MHETGVVVVGGGVTGVGVARDLARRGVDVTLLERGELAAGASGSMHGLLHSGARYAVEDAQSARSCITENRVLREIAADCIEDTGGLFVSLPSDPDDYLDRLDAACADVGIETERLTGAEAREREPGLAPATEAALAVPDGAIDPMALVAATAADAEAHGAVIHQQTPVADLVVEDTSVVGVEVGEKTIRADHVVNAAGAWADRVAALAGVDIEMRASRGAMSVTTGRHADTVVNRCRPKSSGDIVVPSDGHSILGTTDVTVEDPDSFATEEWETELLFEELTPVLPALADAELSHTYWGVRPLYEPQATGDSVGFSRDYSVLDHAERDGVAGLTSAVGGKLTTHRAMAESVSDAVCGRLGVDAESDTADAPLPDAATAMKKYDLDSLVTRTRA
ncbi:FAD-dependent oxidoreductase [Halosegnis longus]|uniref:FAD-dependent oxidoreductase n=1 Tax=Halosegnis longus TaxID=2216012 RepID=UPI00096A515F|nr:FAD-dependent oxidoreductase [Salella cibi]